MRVAAVEHASAPCICSQSRSDRRVPSATTPCSTARPHQQATTPHLDDERLGAREPVAKGGVQVVGQVDAHLRQQGREAQAVSRQMCFSAGAPAACRRVVSKALLL